MESFLDELRVRAVREARASYDARRRHELLSNWYAGNAGWRSATRFFAAPLGTVFARVAEAPGLEVSYRLERFRSQPGATAVPLAFSNELCPARVALRAGAGRVERQPRAAAAERARVLRARKAKHAERGREWRCAGVWARVESFRKCVAALAAHKLLAPRVEVVAAGIDTLELHTKLPISPSWGMRLEGAFDAASATGEPVLVVLAGVELEVQPKTLRGAWALKNAASDVVVRVRADAGADEAAVLVELHSACLWARGWRDAAGLADRICQELVGVRDVDLQVTRLDVCVDFQGWAPSHEDRSLWVTRARKRARYSEGHVDPQWESPEWLEAERKRVVRLGQQLARAESLEEQRRLLEVLHRPPTERMRAVEYDVGALAFSGFAFGHGHHLSSRVYNKTREISVSRKGWFNSVWARCPKFRSPPGGSVAGRVRSHWDVWRLEFQLRRESLQEFTFEAGSGWRDLTAWVDCAARLDDLWRWLTSRWLRHGLRTKEERCVFSAPWRVLNRARIGDGEAVADLERVIPQVGVQPALGNLAGYATTAVAQACEVQQVTGVPYSVLLSQVLSAAATRAEEKAHETVEELIDKKREKLRARREFLARRDCSRERARQQAPAPRRYRTVDGVLVQWTEEDDHRDALSFRWRAERDNALLRKAAETLPF